MTTVYLTFRSPRKAERERFPDVNLVAVDPETAHLVGRIDKSDHAYFTFVPFDAAEPFGWWRRQWHCFRSIEQRVAEQRASR